MTAIIRDIQEWVDANTAPMTGQLNSNDLRDHLHALLEALDELRDHGEG